MWSLSWTFTVFPRSSEWCCRRALWLIDRGTRGSPFFPSDANFSFARLEIYRQLGSLVGCWKSVAQSQRCQCVHDIIKWRCVQDLKEWWCVHDLENVKMFVISTTISQSSQGLIVLILGTSVAIRRNYVSLKCSFITVTIMCRLDVRSSQWRFCLISVRIWRSSSSGQLTRSYSYVWICNLRYNTIKIWRSSCSAWLTGSCPYVLICNVFDETIRISRSSCSAPRTRSCLMLVCFDL